MLTLASTVLLNEGTNGATQMTFTTSGMPPPPFSLVSTQYWIQSYAGGLKWLAGTTALGTLKQFNPIPLTDQQVYRVTAIPTGYTEREIGNFKWVSFTPPEPVTRNGSISAPQTANKAPYLNARIMDYGR